ncbi:MAG: hypothetical protein JWO32_5, partial [Bacteroidetes bacterium]|nr:hypothetical protein [Bacteroidota bacterium]
SGTYLKDVKNPATPSVSAFSAGTYTNGYSRETKSYQKYSYVVSDDGGPNSFQIFDMSNLPAGVNKVYDSQSLFKRGHTLWVDGNKLYVAGITYSNNTTSSMNVYSLATPTAPVLLRKLNQDANFINYVHDMFVRNDTVYASCGNQGLYVFKFNSGTNTFSQLGSLTTYSGSGYNHSSCITPNGQTLVFTDEVPAGLPFKTANVTNLSNIQVLATANQFPQTTPHNVFVVNNQYVFFSSYQDGTQLYDISNPSNPVLAGFFDTFPAGGGNNNNWAGDNYDGQWGMYPYFPSKNIFALDQKNGAFMLKTSLFQNPVSPGSPTVSYISQGTVCAGSVVIFTNTSQGATSYSWSFPGGTPNTSSVTNPTVSYALPGTYNILLSASNGSSSASSGGNIIVKEVQSSITYTNASCSTCTNGAAAATASGGVSPYTYTWLPTGGNTASANGLSPGCYTVNITDAIGCAASKTVCIGSATGLNTFNPFLNTLLYPNPAEETVIIELQGEVFNYTLYNSLSQIVAGGNKNYNACTVNISKLLKGIYVVEIETFQGKTQKKLIIR